MVISMEPQAVIDKELARCFGFNVYFVDDSQNIAAASTTFGAPFFEVAEVVEFDVAEIDNPLTDHSHKSVPFRVLVAENGDAVISNFERWVRTEHKIVELNLRSARVLWSANKCLIVASKSSHRSTLNGVVYITFLEQKLATLLKQVAQYSKTMKADTALTHQVSDLDLLKRGHVNEMTRFCWSARMLHAGIDASLHQMPDELEMDSRRMVVELATALSMSDRLEILDDQIEIMEDLYELANDRLSEYSYYRSEYKLEIWIIVILIVEAAVMLFEALVLAHHG